MLLAAFSLLRQRAWGWWLSLMWTLAEIAYEVGSAAYLWPVAMPAANRMILAVPRDGAGVCSGLVNGNTLTHLVWALFATGFALYPAFVLLLLVLPPVRRSSRPVPRTDEEEWDEAEGDRRRQRRRRAHDD